MLSQFLTFTVKAAPNALLQIKCNLGNYDSCTNFDE